VEYLIIALVFIGSYATGMMTVHFANKLQVKKIEQVEWQFYRRIAIIENALKQYEEEKALFDELP
jgi:hypothetical protein